jgi:hypothetical protein
MCQVDSSLYLKIQYKGKKIIELCQRGKYVFLLYYLILIQNSTIICESYKKINVYCIPFEHQKLISLIKFHGQEINYMEQV